MIKKINTEAYLGVIPDAVAKYQASQVQSKMNGSGRSNFNIEKQVLNGPHQGDITNEITMAQRSQLPGK